MNELISLENLSLRPVSAEILALNEVSSQYGLVLSEEDAKELSDMRNTALVENERVEMGVGAVQEIIRHFCTSRYITEENYAYILNEVTYLFYYIKTETDDKINDHDLIEELFTRFELYCRGSIDTLESREAERIIRKVNSGDSYYKWFRERDELDYDSHTGSREAPVEFDDAEHGAKTLRVSSFDESQLRDDTVADHDMYEDDWEYDPEEDDGFDLDAFDEFFDQQAAEGREERPDPNLAREDLDDGEDEDDE